MHAKVVRDEARRLVGDGLHPAAAAEVLGVSAISVRRWVAAGSAGDRHLPQLCFRCAEGEQSLVLTSAYLYLLGQYLGDGHLATQPRVPVLRIYATTDYPAIADEVSQSIGIVRGVVPGRVRWASSARLISIQSYWTHWPCLIPQHGPGRKHERDVGLHQWQRKLAQQQPVALLRGLLHSDGCWSINTIRHGNAVYTYPRYTFSNESADIMALCQTLLDQLVINWRMCRRNLLAVSRRDDVARLDELIGPKR